VVVVVVVVVVVGVTSVLYLQRVIRTESAGALRPPFLAQAHTSTTMRPTTATQAGGAAKKRAKENALFKKRAFVGLGLVQVRASFHARSCAPNEKSLGQSFLFPVHSSFAR
jgi:hypothetical protein